MSVSTVGVHSSFLSDRTFRSTSSKMEVTYDTGYLNSLEIRWMGPDMSWETGRVLTWNEGNKWTLDLPPGTKSFEYKIVLKRADGAFLFEEGANRSFDPNKKQSLKPPVFNETGLAFRTLKISGTELGISNSKKKPVAVENKIYNLVVGQIIPILAATLSTGRAAIAFTAIPLMAIGMIALKGIAILLKIFTSDKEASFVPNQPIGLNNHGNNCWANSLLQLALNSPVLEQKLRLHPAFSKFFTEYKADQETQQRVASADSQEIREYLHHFVGVRGGEINLGPTHEDPVDALSFILGEGSPGGPLYTLDLHNLVTNVHRRESRPFIDLDLKRGQTFKTLFRNFFETTAEAGKEVKIPQPRLSTFDAPPPMLLIQMKRYTQTGWGNTFQKIKNNDSHPVPLSITLPASRSSSNEAIQYDCEGFIEHQEPTMEKGHYVAYIKREGKWWICNDSTVTEVTLHAVKQAMKKGYMYVFKNPTLEKLETLTQAQKNTVYGRIYRLAGSPSTTDLQWGQNHVRDNLSLLTNAMNDL